MSTNWQYRVVKRMHGGDGKWFDYPSAATFRTEQAAREYAEHFCAEQREAGLSNAAYDVRSRRGTCVFGRGAIVTTYRIA